MAAVLLILLIWVAIYACFYASALLTWNSSWSRGLMKGYLALLVLVQSYTRLISTTRRLANATAPSLALPAGCGAWRWWWHRNRCQRCCC
jgi:tryptophan-rich sensory protein